MNELTKVVCVDNKNDELSLTIGKKYDILNGTLDISYYSIIGNNGLVAIYDKNLFISVKEHNSNRNYKIDKLLFESSLISSFVNGLDYAVIDLARHLLNDKRNSHSFNKRLEDTINTFRDN